MNGEGMTVPALHPTAPVVKTYPIADLRVKAAEDGTTTATFSGIASAVGVLDRHNEVIEKGAFDGTLKTDGPTFVMLYQHDPSKPIGIINLTLDGAGDLRAQGEINLDTELGRETYSLMKQGALKAMSIGFNIPEGGAVWDQDAGLLRILAVELWEVSVVTFPANPGAVIDSVKHVFAIGPDAEKAGKVLSAKNQGLVQAAHDALGALLAAADTTPPADGKSVEPVLQAPTYDPTEIAEVKGLIALMRATLSEGDSPA